MTKESRLGIPAQQIHFYKNLCPWNKNLYFHRYFSFFFAVKRKKSITKERKRRRTKNTVNFHHKFCIRSTEFRYDKICTENQQCLINVTSGLRPEPRFKLCNEKLFRPLWNELQKVSQTTTSEVCLRYGKLFETIQSLYFSHFYVPSCRARVCVTFCMNETAGRAFLGSTRSLR